jgi:hypothetical protein
MSFVPFLSPVAAVDVIAIVAAVAVFVAVFVVVILVFAAVVVAAAGLADAVLSLGFIPETVPVCFPAPVYASRHSIHPAPRFV